MTRVNGQKNVKTTVQQYTTTAAHLDQLGEQARKLRQEMADTTDAVADTREELKGYNERRREQTAELKEILTPLVRHLQAGGTANGVTGLHNWAAWYNPTAKDGKNAARQIMRIVNSPKPGEKQGDIKSPMALNIDKIEEAIKQGRKVTVTSGSYKYALTNVVLNKGTIFLSIDGGLQKELQRERRKKTEPKTNKTRLRHVPNPRFTGVSLCADISLRDSNKATKRYPATCPKCVELAAQLPPEPPKVKKITAAATQEALDKFWRDLLSTPKNEKFRPEDLLTEFEAVVAQHPEWQSYRVSNKRHAAEDHVRALKVQEERALKVNVRLTEAQSRVVEKVKLVGNAVLDGFTLRFDPATYQEDAKALVLGLEQWSKDASPNYEGGLAADVFADALAVVSGHRASNTSAVSAFAFAALMRPSRCHFRITWSLRSRVVMLTCFASVVCLGSGAIGSDV